MSTEREKKNKPKTIDVFTVFCQKASLLEKSEQKKTESITGSSPFFSSSIDNKRHALVLPCIFIFLFVARFHRFTQEKYKLWKWKWDFFRIVVFWLLAGNTTHNTIA